MRDLLSLLGPLPPRNNKEPSWFERDAGDSRLALDRKLISSAFPHLKYGLNFRRHEVFLRGNIVIREATSGIPTAIATEVRFPSDYPEAEPRAYEIGNMFPHEIDRHFYPDSEACCLWLPPESQWKGNDPEALLKFLFHVAVFYERQLVFDASGGKVWPWGERGHGIAGYDEYFADRLGGAKILEVFRPVLVEGMSLSRSARCLCGSRRRYKHCHETVVKELQEVAAKYVRRALR